MSAPSEPAATFADADRERRPNRGNERVLRDSIRCAERSAKTEDSPFGCPWAAALTNCSVVGDSEASAPGRAWEDPAGLREEEGRERGLDNKSQE